MSDATFEQYFWESIGVPDFYKSSRDQVYPDQMEYKRTYDLVSADGNHHTQKVDVEGTDYIVVMKQDNGDVGELAFKTVDGGWDEKTGLGAFKVLNALQPAMKDVISAAIDDGKITKFMIDSYGKRKVLYDRVIQRLGLQVDEQGMIHLDNFEKVDNFDEFYDEASEEAGMTSYGTYTDGSVDTSNFAPDDNRMPFFSGLYKRNGKVKKKKKKNKK